jgi:hypothetical protein
MEGGPIDHRGVAEIIAGLQGKRGMAFLVGSEKKYSIFVSNERTTCKLDIHVGNH